jgi:hypothetical protein
LRFEIGLYIDNCKFIIEIKLDICHTLLHQRVDECKGLRGYHEARIVIIIQVFEEINLKTSIPIAFHNVWIEICYRSTISWIG